MCSTLPVEVLDHIFQDLTRDGLYRVLQANSLFYSTANRILYRSLVGLGTKQSIACLRSFGQNDLFPTLVRELMVDWSNCYLLSSQLVLLHKTLTRLTALTSLSVVFGKRECRQPLAWIFDSCTFSLRYFRTTISCDASLARFLESQAHITELSLRGVQSPSSFTLQPSALPKLSVFRSLLSEPSLYEEVISGRPISGASLAISTEHDVSVLDSLALSSQVILRLSVMSVGIGNPNRLVSEISERFPDLQILHVILYRRLSFVSTTFCLIRVSHTLSIRAEGSCKTKPIARPIQIIEIFYNGCPAHAFDDRRKSKSCYLMA
jgi:hypothetical protein